MALDKLKFWKKKDEDFPELSAGMSGGGLGPASMGSESAQYSGSAYPEPSTGTGLPGTFGMAGQGTTDSSESRLIQKDMELISAKLDALRADLDQINQRLANIEVSLGAQRRHTPSYGYP